MNRLNLMLLIAVLLSGMVLVSSAYDARQLFTARDRARAEALRLEADYQRLQAERHAQATNLRVEQVARERLQMRVITPAITHGLNLGAAPSASASGVQR